MLIAATAGHIDHGKTALVRALTGIDTDKLPEERARGISIDLGFAYWEAERGALIAFVDVPGHQRFIRNMLAGVAAIHFALVVVAVDDGPMPQTIEHLQILDFLGVRSGVVVLSKADTASPERIAEVSAAVRALLKGTALADIPTLAVSARTGTGIAELKKMLAQCAREHEQSKAERVTLARRARFAIDRVFKVHGAGTIVTGTVYDGRIACEDRLIAFPSGAMLRVRGIQMHGRDVPLAVSGERAAVNVTGPHLPQLSRGDWLADPAIGATGKLMDVQLSILHGTAPLRHASRARLYLGASEATVRVLLHGKNPIEPGESVPVRLHLEQPVLAVNGDRFVLRDGPATATLGGGFVVDPCPPSRRRFMADDEFWATASGDPVSALRAMLATRGNSSVDLARFERIFSLQEQFRDSAVAACGALVLGRASPYIVSKAHIEEVTKGAAETLRRDPRDAIPIAELRDAVAPELPVEAFEFLLRANAERLDANFAGGAVALRKRADVARSADMVDWQKVRRLLADAALQPPDVAELSRVAGIVSGKLRAMLHAQAKAGEIYPLQPEKYIVRELVAQLAASAGELAERTHGGRFTAAQYRDAIGTGRVLAIQVLELLDAIGITRRSGDERTIVRSAQAIFGSTTAYRAAPLAAPVSLRSARSAPRRH